MHAQASSICTVHRVIDAPWKVPGTETSAFFNYSLTPAKWRAYVREIQQAHAELRMQGRIQLYDPPSSTARDPDMPPELVAALAGKVRIAAAVCCSSKCRSLGCAFAEVCQMFQGTAVCALAMALDLTRSCHHGAGYDGLLAVW